jgi:glycosyltransferase involved in cell wall biosynthesis
MIIILNIGPHKHAQGGIASVIRTYTQYINNSQFSIRQLATVKDGNRMRKMFMAMKAYASAPFEIVRADIVHVHTASWNSWRRKVPLVILSKLLRRKLVIHIHGGGFANFLSSMSRSRLWLNTFFLSLADCIVCLSNSKRAELAKYLHTVPMLTLPNPCRLIPAKVNKKQKYGIEILFTGLIVKSKGVFDLIRAFAIVVEEHLGRMLRLVIAGKGDTEACRKLACECGVVDKVILPGWLTSNALQDAYEQADIYCLPSYIEGVPMGILEAMAFALPIVTCPVGGIPDIVDDGIHGLFTPPGDINNMVVVLKRLINNKAEREKMGAACRSRVLSRYSPEQVCSQLFRFYYSLLMGSELEKASSQENCTSEPGIKKQENYNIYPSQKVLSESAVTCQENGVSPSL